MNNHINTSAGRFIILSTARTGSNLLMSLLSVHEKIKIYGELFNLDRLPQPELKIALEDPVLYLKDKIYDRLPDGKRIAGFKLFYDHLTADYFNKLVDTELATEKMKKRFHDLNEFIRQHCEPEEMFARFQQAKQYLVDDKDLKIIHLTRRNKLHTLVSLKTAYATSEWMHWSAEERNKTVLNLDVEECRNYFDKIETCEQSVTSIYQGHDIIEVAYEELAANRANELDRIFGFLGLENKKSGTILKKQILFPMTEVIENFRDLQQAFSGTRWQEFFN